MINKLKAKLEELTRLEEIANKADYEMMADPENEEKENAFDLAYQKEYNAYEEAVKMVVDITSGRIVESTAKILVKTKREEILSILKNF